jgi:hypothetical protein
MYVFAKARDGPSYFTQVSGQSPCRNCIILGSSPHRKTNRSVRSPRGPGKLRLFILRGPELCLARWDLGIQWEHRPGFQIVFGKKMMIFSRE